MNLKRINIILITLLVIASLLIGIAIRTYVFMTPDAEDIKEQMVTFDESKGVLNILVIGVDDVEEINRSDTVLLVRIDIDKKGITVMSIPRDTRTMVKNRQDKINHAYAYGGKDMLKNAVINLTGVPIDYYVTINYKSFPKVVDVLGGVTLDVQKNLRYTDKAAGLYIDIKKGVQKMDGATALKYVRFRNDAMGDVGRMERQQQFLYALMSKLKNPMVVLRIPELSETIFSMIETDMPLPLGLQLAGYLRDVKLKDVNFFTLPGISAYVNGVSYWIPDLGQVSAMLLGDKSAISEDMIIVNPLVVDEPLSQDLPPMVIEAMNREGSSAGNDDFDYGSSDKELSPEELLTQIKFPIAILNGNGVGGITRQFSSRMEKLGMEVGRVGNARHFGYLYSVVLYPEKEGPQKAKLLADMLGIRSALVRPGGGGQSATLVLGKDYQIYLDKLDKIKIPQ